MARTFPIKGSMSAFGLAVASSSESSPPRSNWQLTHDARLRHISNIPVVLSWLFPRMPTRMWKKRQSTNLTCWSLDGGVANRISSLTLIFCSSRQHVSILIGILSWLFSVESSVRVLHISLRNRSFLQEISHTNYTGARDYVKRLITLVGAKFTPSMSQYNNVLVASHQPKTTVTRALSRSIHLVGRLFCGVVISTPARSPPVVLFTQTSALTVGLERYIMYPLGVDFGKILMTRHDAPSSQSMPAQCLSGGAVLGDRGIGIIDLE
ncbi:hypothetical protein OG21DRAFT_744777 [Imleria badia]|nr:hypothetical protein OG21DRAFT_744777 [Imleria badia]